LASIVSIPQHRQPVEGRRLLDTSSEGDVANVAHAIGAYALQNRSGWGRTGAAGLSRSAGCAAGARTALNYRIQNVQCLAYRGKAPGVASQRLHDHVVLGAPHDPIPHRAALRVESQNFLVGIASNAGVKLDHKVDVAIGRPRIDRDEVGEIEGKTLWRVR